MPSRQCKRISQSYFISLFIIIFRTIQILQTLPWSLKLVFGFLSDICPIAGQHRKPYLSIGALLYSIALISYSLSGAEDVVILALAIFAATMGMIMMDVMADTMVSYELSHKYSCGRCSNLLL